MAHCLSPIIITGHGISSSRPEIGIELQLQSIRVCPSCCALLLALPTAPAKIIAVLIVLHITSVKDLMRIFVVVTGVGIVSIKIFDGGGERKFNSIK
jgi:hypothetical protein